MKILYKSLFLISLSCVLISCTTKEEQSNTIKNDLSLVNEFLESRHTKTMDSDMAQSIIELSETTYKDLSSKTQLSDYDMSLLDSNKNEWELLVEYAKAYKKGDEDDLNYYVRVTLDPAFRIHFK